MSLNRILADILSAIFQGVTNPLSAFYSLLCSFVPLHVYAEAGQVRGPAPDAGKDVRPMVIAGSDGLGGAWGGGSPRGVPAVAQAYTGCVARFNAVSIKLYQFCSSFVGVCVLGS